MLTKQNVVYQSGILMPSFNKIRTGNFLCINFSCVQISNVVYLPQVALVFRFFIFFVCYPYGNKGEIAKKASMENV